MRFRGKAVVITGASGGIGREAAEAFHREGAKLAVVGRDRERTAEVARTVEADYSSTADITDSKNCRAILEEAASRMGGLDILVNNAGAMFRGDVAETGDEDWLRLFDINVHSVFYLSREAIRIMRAGRTRGAIVQVASNSAVRGRKGHIAYATTKGAVLQMTRCLALDCAEDGIRVNAVCPGATDTGMPMSMHRTPMTREKLMEICRDTIPLGRIAAVEEVVRPILFLASDESGYMTGAAVSVDGGTSA